MKPPTGLPDTIPCIAIKIKLACATHMIHGALPAVRHLVTPQRLALVWRRPRWERIPAVQYESHVLLMAVRHCVRPSAGIRREELHLFLIPGTQRAQWHNRYPTWHCWTG